jgi:uncharacterized protein (DUF2384 family)
MLAAPRDARVVALSAFFKIVGEEHWNLGREDRATLLAASPRSVSRWQSEGVAADLTRDQLERISYVLGIYAGLRAVLGDVEFADEWVRRPNADFGDRTPLDRMLAGNVGDLAEVRSYVDRWAAGW